MEQIEKIRALERSSHNQIYSQYTLFQKGSWLAKPVATVMEILPMLDGRVSLKILDLGSGVGRNAIAVAQYFLEKPCQVDCVDHLPLAVEKLLENAEQYEVTQSIRGYISTIETFEIPEVQYDLVLCISSLEHVESKAAFCDKLKQICKGIKPKGIVCLIVNTEVQETDSETKEKLVPQFEVNYSTEELRRLLEKMFQNWRIVKQTTVPQQYAIPRENRMALLRTNVVTFVALNR